MLKRLFFVYSTILTHGFFAQNPYFVIGERFYQFTENEVIPAESFVDQRELIKYPAIYHGKNQVSENLELKEGFIFYQAAENSFNNEFAVLERNRFTRDFSLFLYNPISKAKTELFSQNNLPFSERALKPIGFISEKELLVELLMFDSHLDHEGMYILNTETKTLEALGMEEKVMSTPILNEEKSVLYYISTSDETYDVIHGNYNVLKSFELVSKRTTTLFTSTGDPINFRGWEAKTDKLKKQLNSNQSYSSTKSIVDYRLPYDSLTGYYVSRHGTPAPFGAHVSSGYDAVYTMFNAHGYPAVDFDTPDTQHDNILASAPGIVTFAGISCGLTCGYGRLVIIEHADGRRTYNGHMSTILVSVGDCVGYGTVIGKEGTTGGSSGDHQHFEWREAGGSTSELVAFNDVGMPRQAYYYISNTPTLACGINSPITVPSDNIDPLTTVITPTGFQFQNFTASFTDDDNSGGSGISKAFYQPIDYNGAEWRANANNGFFSDNFDLTSLHTDWINTSGTWTTTAGGLVQSDEVSTNTNVSAYIKSNLSNRYLFHVELKIDGAGTNRRAGFHYFASNATTTNRTSGYFVWLRADDDIIEIYKVTADVFTLIASAPYTISTSTWYDIKLTYDRIAGKHQVFVNNNLALAHTDTAPHTLGDYFSFRTGNAKLTVNQLKVFRSRYPNATIQVGPTGDLRYSNPSPSTPAGKVKSINTDNAGNISTVVSSDVNVDFSVPLPVNLINDGTGSDISSTAVTNSASVNWSATTDPNSGIMRYFYALGSSAGGTDIVNWTDNGVMTSATANALNLIPGQTYYFSLKAENNATLINTFSSSNGFIIDNPIGLPSANFVSSNTNVCSNDSISFSNLSTNASDFEWSFPGGSPANSTEINPTIYYGSSGNYTATLTAANGASTDLFSSNFTVTVNSSPIADFTPTNTLLTLSSGATVYLSNTSTNSNAYTWDFGDGNVSSDTNPWWSYETAGNYTITLVSTSASCGSDSATVIIEVVNDLGISEQENVFSVSSDGSEIEISSKVNAKESFQLFDSSGRLVYEKTIELSSNEQVSIVIYKTLSVGSYLFKIGDYKGKVLMKTK